VIIQAKEKTDEIDTWCKTFDAEFVKRRRFRDPFSFFSEIKFINKLRKIKTDKIWFNTLTAYQVILARIFLKNFLVSVHDVEFHPGMSDLHSKIFLWLTFRFLKKNVCVVSKAQADMFENKFGIKPRIFQLPIIEYYQDISPGIHAVEVKSANPVKFFFFSSIEKYKGIETLLEAVKILNNESVNFELGIYGKLKYSEDKLTEEIGKLKNVYFQNQFVDFRDVHRIFVENDVLILPFKQVTQCGPLLIAYDENMPVICSDLPGFKEYIDDYESGIIYKNTAGDLVDKMKYLINNSAKLDEMRKYISSNMKRKYSMELLADVYLKNLQDSKKG